MSILAQDLTPTDEQRLIAFWRTVPVWRRIQIIGELYETAELLALADLRRRFPDETQEQLSSRLLVQRERLEQLHHAS